MAVPTRVSTLVLAAMLMVVVPSPDPVLPAAMVIQAVLLVAVQVHPVAAVTVTVAVPAVATAD
jgi:hypothetical protein